MYLLVFFYSRGTADEEKKSIPFRKWYGQLLEIQPLLSNPQIAVFIATASKTTKRKLFDLLQLNILIPPFLKKNPLKDNIRSSVNHVSNESSLDEIIFLSLINEIKQRHEKVRGTLIFCTTRKQCSPVYKAFAVALDEKLYLDGNKDPRKRIVDMYHAGTPEKVKEHILSQLISMQGHLRVLI